MKPSFERRGTSEAVDPFSSPTSIAIVGLGVRSAVGLTAPAAAAAVRAGISALQEHPYMLDKAGEPMVVAREPTLDPALQRAERFALLAGPAVKEALGPLAQRGVTMESLQAVVGTPDPRPGLPVGLEGALNRMVASAVESPTSPRTTILANGHAAGLLAMQYSRDLLHAGRTRFCLAGGVDSYLTADSLEWMDEEGILKSSENRNGFPPGEAAGFCLLATGATALEFDLPVLGWLETWGRAREESPIRTQTICVGRGLSQAIKQATAPLRLPDERVDDSICDLNGEPYRSEEFALTVLRTQLAFVDATRFVTPADCWGDIGAASGPLFASLAVAAAQRGYAKGPRTLIWASSERGDRAAAVVFTPVSAGGRGR
jgi:3-oxoacyl-[acyl-carrier-protein] synthase-1